jgi:hypothetical protein
MNRRPAEHSNSYQVLTNYESTHTAITPRNA